MEYNLLPGALWSVNLIEGNKNVSFNILNSLASGTGVALLELTHDDILVLDFDLGKNISTSRIEYEFETPYASSSAVAAGVEFSYKEESFETDYISLETFVSVEPNKYTATASGIWAPRYLRLKHDLSLTSGITTITGSVYGIQVINNDEVVNFGATGQLNYASIEVARGGNTDIRTIPIFNNGVYTADALVNIEPSFTDLDTAISVSESTTGPWVYPISSDKVVFNADTLDYGGYYLTSDTYGDLRLSGWEDVDGNYTSRYSLGTYTTRVIHDTSNNGLRLNITKQTPQTGRLAVDKEDAVETIEIRSTDTPPKDYAVFRELISWYVPYKHYYGYRDRWRETGAIKGTSADYFVTGSRYTYLHNYQVVQDSTTERWAGWFTNHGTDSHARAQLYIFNNIGAVYNTKVLSEQAASGEYSINTSWREVKLDAAGGIWLYFFCQGYDSGDWCNMTGYYLAYFNSNLIQQFKWYDPSEQIQDLDVDYTFSYVWYTRPELGAIYKLSISGNTVVNYIDAHDGFTNNLQGLVVLPDQQGIWFGNDGNLHRLSDSGVLLEEFTIEGVATGTIKYLALDGDGSEKLWVLEGSTLGLFNLVGEKRGTYDFRVVLSYPLRLEATPTGCWVYCVDLNSDGTTYIRFVSKENKRVDLEYSPSGTSRPGPIEMTYEHPTYVEKMPIAIDSHWSGLEWQKVAISNYLLPESAYHQVRLTLRRQEPIERYSFVTDSEEDYSERDQFDQTTSTPNELLWSDWRDKSLGDGLSRVYVDTNNKELVMVPEQGGTLNSYIETKNRVVTAKSNGEIEVRVSYRFADGNVGLATGRQEMLYLYGFAIDANKIGNYIGVYVRIPVDPLTYNVVVGSIVSSYISAWDEGVVAKSLDYYQGTLQLFAKSNDKLYAYLASGDSTSFISDSCVSDYWNSNGSHWYWQIVADRNSSQVVITDFWVRQGDNYFYTETPKVVSMHTQDLVKVSDIHPQSSKNVYVRTQIPKDSSLSSNYETDLKVRWRTPVY